MAILEKIITLCDVTGGFESKLENYGKIRDTIGHFSYIFKSGIYVIEGECTIGGWALSTLLSGREKLTSGQILIDNEIVSCKELQKYSCYVGEDSGLKKWFGIMHMSVSEQIKYGIKKGLTNDSVDEIKNKFKLSDGRFDRRMKYFSGERWRASMAIGYALGKRIYCFPWISGKFIMKFENCFQTCFQPLLESESTIIIPTTNHHALENIVDSYEVVKI